MAKHSASGDALKKLLDRKSLRRMAGERSFERGEDYFTGRRVGSLVADDDKITAKVKGTHPYRVELWLEGGHLGYSCTCPVGTDGAFCKHCVAVGLAFLEQEDPARGKPRGTRKPSLTIEDIRKYLRTQGKDSLAEMLVEQAMEDDRLLQRLFMKAAKQSPGGIDIATYRAAIDRAIYTDEFVDYRGMYDYARDVSDVIDSVAELLKEGHAAEVIELTEHALAAVEDTMGSVDDSDGQCPFGKPANDENSLAGAQPGSFPPRCDGRLTPSG